MHTVSDLRNVTPRLGVEVQDFVVVVDLHLTFSFLVVKMESCRHRFCGAEFQLPSLKVVTYGCRVVAQHSFHCQPVSISMHDC